MCDERGTESPVMRYNSGAASWHLGFRVLAALEGPKVSRGSYVFRVLIGSFSLCVGICVTAFENRVSGI